MAISDEVALDIRAAQRSIDQLEAQMSAAFAGISVSIDTVGLTRQIQTATAGINADVEVTADTTGIDPAISRALEGADTSLEITGNAAAVTGAVQGAIDAVDTNLEITGDASRVVGSVEDGISEHGPFGPVEVGGQLSPGLNTDVLNLGANIADANEEGSKLKGILAGLGVAAVGKGLFELADAASEAEQAMGGTEAVFGEAKATIAAFATTSASAAGIAATAARNLTSQIGGLLKGFGFTRQEAARTSIVLAQLGADLAATFGGRPEEAVEALGGALRGEFNPLERFGVSLNIAQINAYALEKGMAASTSEIDIATRAQAALALIMERTADAQGQFARESDTAAGAISIASAGAQDLAANAGRNLTPALLALVDVVERRVLPALAAAGDDVLPAISDAIVNLAPLLGVTTELFVALSPVIGVVADILASIPDEAISIGAALLVANQAFGGLGSILSGLGPSLSLFPQILAGTAQALPTATTGVGGLATGVTGLATGIANLNPLVVAGGIAAAGLFFAWQQSKEAARQFEEEVSQLSSSLETVDGRSQLTTKGIARYVEEQSRINAKDQVDELGALGISFQQVAGFAQQGQAGLNRFAEALITGGDLTEVFRNEFGEIVTATGEVIDANSKLGQSLEDIGFGRLVVGNTDLIKSYMEVGRVTEELSKRQLELLQGQGLVTDAQVRTALGMNDSGEATISYAEALNKLEPVVTKAARAQEEAISTAALYKSQYLGVADALENLNTVAPGAAAAITALRDGGDASGRAMLNVALALDQAALSEADFADAAAALGTDVESLQGFIDSATTAIGDFVDAATSGLPDVSGVLDDVRTSLQASEDELARTQERDARTISVGAAQLSQGLRVSALKVADWRNDLAAITKAGFADVAGLLATSGIEAGDALADELSNALANGNTKLLEELSAANTTFQDQTQETIDYMRDVLGPELILVSGLMGEGAAEALFEGADFGERMRIQGALAKTELDEQGRIIAVAAATQGEEAARQFGENLQLDQETIEAGVAAGLAMIASAPTADARTAGESVGTAFGDGFISGIRKKELEAAFAAQGLTGAALIAARKLAGINSPSTVMMRYGEFMGEGLAIGLQRSIPGLIAATRQTITAVTNLGSSATLGLQVRPDVQAIAGGAGPGVQIDYDRLAQAITAALPASSDSVQLVVQGASVDGAHATATETMRQLQAERYRQTGFAG